MKNFATGFMRIIGSLCTLAGLWLSGCSAGFTNQDAAPATSVSGATIHGRAMGGEQPLIGAKLYFFATGSTGYGSLSRSLLISPAAGGHNTIDDGNGLYYVTTDENGYFSISGDYTCPGGGAQVYLLSEGGNPGNGMDNPAAVLMVAMGNCGDLTSNTNVILNEVTTVAAAFALQQFTNSPTSIGSTASNQQGITQAFVTISALVVMSYGGAQPSTPIYNRPEDKIYSLANAISACVNSTGPSSTTCQLLFNAAVPPDGYAAATDTFTALLNIARNPGGNPAGIFNLVPPTPPFPQMLKKAPHDYSLSIGYTQGLQKPTTLAIDAAGYVWVANCGWNCNNQVTGADDVVLFASSGEQISPSGFGVGSVSMTQGLGVDQSSFIWSINAGTGTSDPASVSILQPSGIDAAGSPHMNTRLSQPKGMAVDAQGYGWIANAGNQTVTQVSKNGVFNTPYHPAGMTSPHAVAIDSNGHVIVSDDGAQGQGGVAILNQVNGTEMTFSTLGAAHPTALALDANHNIWELDSTSNQIFELDGSGGLGQVGGSGISIPNTFQLTSMAVDGFGQVLVPSCYKTCTGVSTDPSDALFILDTLGNVATPATGLQSSTLSNPVAIALDAAGNVWIANANNSSITEFVGVAGPVQTPMATALSNSTIGTRP